MNTPWLSQLESSLLANASKPPQALCLMGVPGLGLSLLAERFAQAVLKAPDLHHSPDYLKISPESGKSIGIDTVREINEFCLLSPTLGQYKIVHLDPVEALTLPAQQALLKTLEEPVAPLCFILVCTSPNKLLPTIRSRTQVYKVQPVPYSQVASSVQVSEEEYALTDGGPLLLEEPAFESRRFAYHRLISSLNKNKITAPDFQTLSKAAPKDVLTGFYYALLKLRSFDKLDRCTELLKTYSENPNLNWEMNLRTFLLECEPHVV